MDPLFGWGMISKLLLAGFFGATVGLERYIHGRPAGFRTYLLVCVAFASIALLGEKLTHLSGPATTLQLRADPGRIMAGGLTGIGFLGAGIILRGGSAIHGLTTAAGIWATSVVGLAVGSGAHDLAIVLYIITLLSLLGLRRIEQGVKKDIFKRMEICSAGPVIKKEALEEICAATGLRIIRLDMAENRPDQILSYRLTLNGRTEESFHKAYQRLASLEGIRSIELTGDTIT